VWHLTRPCAGSSVVTRNLDNALDNHLRVR
jgi:hypothetical protein